MGRCLWAQTQGPNKEKEVIPDLSVGRKQGGRRRGGAAHRGRGLHSQGTLCRVDEKVHLVELALRDGSIGHQQADSYGEGEVRREGLENRQWALVPARGRGRQRSTRWSGGFGQERPGPWLELACLYHRGL